MKRIQRILALSTVVFLVVMVLLTLYFAVTGSPYFMASMVTTFTLPLLIYVYLFVYRLMKGSPEEESKKDNNIDNKNKENGNIDN